MCFLGNVIEVNILSVTEKNSFDLGEISGFCQGAVEVFAVLGLYGFILAVVLLQPFAFIFEGHSVREEQD